MSTLYLPIPEEQEGWQALHFEPVCQVGLLINIYDSMIHWNSLCELGPRSLIPRLLQVLQAGLARGGEQDKPAGMRPIVGISKGMVTCSCSRGSSIEAERDSRLVLHTIFLSSALWQPGSCSQSPGRSM